MTSNKIGSAIVMLFVLAFVVTAHAGTVDLNDVYNAGNPFSSDNFMWTDITETNGAPLNPAINYYQDPVFFGDTMVVNPVNFRVDVTPGPGIATIDSQLEMVIMSTNGATIDQILFKESGDYQVIAINPNESSVMAEVTYFWQVLEGTNPGASGSGSVMFDSSAAPNNSGIWDLEFTADIPTGATKVRFEFDNRLTATANTELSAAFIAKKLIDGITVQPVVPEPSSALLWVVGVLMLLNRRR